MTGRLDPSLTDGQFRDLARTWLNENLPTGHRPHGISPAEIAEAKAFDRAWQRTQHDGGWAGIGWPVEYGGCGLSLSRQLIWSQEAARAGAPDFDSTWLGINHAGPTVMARGSEAQKLTHLPAILRGDETWCQGFSEPGAGSDLAGLRTKGVVDGDHIVVTGQKIWTTLAHLCERQELLIRTDPDSKRFRGLTWIIGDMTAPGITIRPLRSLGGDYHCCEVFYDEVRLPLANVVGQVNDGWSVAMTTLSFERGTASFGEVCHLQAMVEEMIEHARSNSGDDGRALIRNEALAEQLGAARAEVDGLMSLLHLTIARAGAGVPQGAESSMVRLYLGELAKRVTKLALEMVGVQGLNRDRFPRWMDTYYMSFAQTIAGGSCDIQRNIIGERVLGLPR